MVSDERLECLRRLKAVVSVANSQAMESERVRWAHVDSIQAALAALEEAIKGADKKKRGGE
jgi:hypothetical protein